MSEKNYEDILEAVIKKWNDYADGYNQWDDLGSDEQFELIIDYCMKISRKIKKGEVK